jgi:hypothetical protein
LKTSGNIRSVPSRSSYLFIILRFFFLNWLQSYKKNKLPGLK